MNSDDVPRRNRTNHWTMVEKAIYAAAQMVEGMPADERLTKAVVLLGEARGWVADYVDKVAIEDHYPRPAAPVAAPIGTGEADADDALILMAERMAQTVADYYGATFPHAFIEQHILDALRSVRSSQPEQPREPERIKGWARFATHLGHTYGDAYVVFLDGRDASPTDQNVALTIYGDTP